MYENPKMVKLVGGIYNICIYVKLHLYVGDNVCTTSYRAGLPNKMYKAFYYLIDIHR